MNLQHNEEHLKKMANFLRDVFPEFWLGTPGQPSVYLTLCSAEEQSEIKLRVDEGGLVVDVPDKSL